MEPRLKQEKDVDEKVLKFQLDIDIFLIIFFSQGAYSSYI